MRNSPAHTLRSACFASGRDASPRLSAVSSGRARSPPRAWLQPFTSPRPRCTPARQTTRRSRRREPDWKDCCRRLDEAERALRTALDLAPGRLQTIAELADVLAVREKFDEAERLLDSAQEAAARTGTDLGPWRERVAREREVARIRGDLQKAASLGRAEAAPRPRTRGGRTGRWLIPPGYRQTGPGEQRTHGLLRRIDCETGHITVQVATADGTRRFTAKSLAAVQAVSYREGFEPLLACGPRREMEPVFVTWKPAAGAGGGGGARALEGTLVVLEFLGEEYLPR